MINIRNQNEQYEKQRIETEQTMAASIHADILPNTYPAFPDRPEIDVYATMDPAKEVGGDFYDFFLIDDDHLCLVMADMSGKGIPAALFMMASRIILANNAMLGKSPALILTDANAAIFANNRERLFVYTDGVPEAADADKRLFGKDRMLDALNADPDATPEQLLKNVRAAVDGFVKDAEQFDDLTMLCVEYRGTKQP